MQFRADAHHKEFRAWPLRRSSGELTTMKYPCVHPYSIGGASQYSSRRLRLGPTALLLLSLSFVSISALSWMALSSPLSAFPTKLLSDPRSPHTAETDDSLMHTQTIGDFYKANRTAVLDTISKNAQADSQYRTSLLRITEQYVMGLQGFTDSQRRELWHRIKDAQNCVR